MQVGDRTSPAKSKSVLYAVDHPVLRHCHTSEVVKVEAKYTVIRTSILDGKYGGLWSSFKPQSEWHYPAVELPPYPQHHREEEYRLRDRQHQPSRPA